MLGEEGPRPRRAKAVFLREIAELEQRVVVVPVAVDRDEQRGGALPLYPREPLRRGRGNPPAVDRGGEEDELVRAEALLLRVRAGQVDDARAGQKRLCQRLRDHRRRARGTENERRQFGDLHSRYLHFLYGLSGSSALSSSSTPNAIMLTITRLTLTFSRHAMRSTASISRSGR